MVSAGPGVGAFDDASRGVRLEKLAGQLAGERGHLAGRSGARLVITTPDARRSIATLMPRVKDARRLRSPIEPVRFELTDAVLVRVRDDAVAARVAGLPGVRGVEQLRDGLLRVRTGSVRAALAVRAQAAELDGVTEAMADLIPPYETRGLPSDPGFGNQWYLNNTAAGAELFDANVEPVWAMGLSGDGVTVGVLEGGFQTTHPDLAANYSASSSMSGGFSASHGTSVAGIIGMVAGNDAGGAGAAFGSRLSKLVYGSTSQTAAALSFDLQTNAIINNSWGPVDNGSFWNISTQELGAIVEGVTDGRNGLGTLYVWAGGNGRGALDRVDYDPFASSRYTIAIGSIGNLDTLSPYSEPGSSLLACAHSNGNGQNIWTTTSGSNYTSNFGGTSAASPLASGILALVLEANPSLTWRDVQHLIIENARRNDPGSPTWITNGAGYTHSYDYGFGAMDAEALVLAAQQWQPVEPEISAETAVVAVNEPLPDNDLSGVTRTIMVDDSLRIESVELLISATGEYMGDLVVDLIAPSGMVSRLSEPRVEDRTQLNSYVLTSLRHWGEDSAGEWTVILADGFPSDLNTWDDFQIRFHGTAFTQACPPDISTEGANPGDPGFGDPDGQVTVADLTYFVELWIGGDAAADRTTDSANPGEAGFGTPDGSVLTGDLTYFVELWIGGCPG